MTDNQTPMTPEERDIALRGWDAYCYRRKNINRAFCQKMHRRVVR